MEPATPPDAPPPPRPSYSLPGWAFSLSILGCLMLPIPFALVMGLVSLRAIHKNPSLPGRGLALAAVALSVFWAGLLVLRLIPNFINFGARARTSECHSNLRSLYQAQKSYFTERRLYSEFVTDLGVDIERRNRYAYFLSPRGPFEVRSAGELDRPANATGVLPEIRVSWREEPIDSSSPYVRAIPATLAGNVPVGLSGTCPDCDITMVCLGDIDGDPGLDVWSISTKERQGPDGSIPAGEPYNDVADLAHRD